MSTETQIVPTQPFCLSLSIQRPGVRKKVESDNEALDTDVDREMLHFSKDIIKCDEYDALRKFAGTVRFTVKKRSAGNSNLKSGIFFYNPAALLRVLNYLEQQKAEHEVLVDAFMARYDGIKSDARPRLGPLFDDTDYPHPDVVRKAFGLTWQVFSFPNVDALKEVSPEIYEREAAKVRVLFEEALDASRQMLRTEFAEAVTGLYEAFEPDANGKLKKLNKKSTSRVLDYIREFGTREISNDTELRAVMAEMATVLQATDPDKVRKSDDLRAQAQATIGGFKDKIAALAEVPVGGRKYVFASPAAEIPVQSIPATPVEPVGPSPSDVDTFAAEALSMVPGVYRVPVFSE